MTIRELVALVLLYRVCQDPDIKRRVEELVPELKDFDLKVIPWPRR